MSESTTLTWNEIMDNLANVTFAQVVVPTGNTEVTRITNQAEVDAQKSFIRRVRDTAIQKEAWRYDRHNREVRLGLTPTDSPETMVLLDTYIKELTDVPSQEGFPYNVTWPALPK